MKLVLHVGFHKTGSSAIQSFCRENSDYLARQGTLYPQTALVTLDNPSTPTSEAGHRLFSNVLASPTNRMSRSLLEELVNEARSITGIHTIVISSETFSAPKVILSDASRSVLEEYFDDIRVLVYLRRQDDWSESMYKEVLCWKGTRESRSLQQFCNRFLQPWLNYSDRLEKWSAIFGEQNMIVKSYDCRTDKNIIRDFLQVLEVAESQLDDCDAAPASNPSLPGDLTPLMRELNALKLDKQQKSTLTSSIYRQLEKSQYRVNRANLVSDSMRSRFAAEYRAENLALCRRYGIRECPYFLYDEQRPPSGQETSLDRQQVEAVRQEAREMIRASKMRRSLNRQRANLGRVGISCLLNESPQQVEIFVAYHLAIGVFRIRLYFDNPDDPMAHHDYASSHVEVIRCTPEFWHQNLGREPDNNAEKLATCHQDGLNYLTSREDIDWAVNLDADELLYINQNTSLDAVLSQMPARVDQVQVRPLEAIFVDADDSRLFGARYFKVPRLDLHGDKARKKKGLLIKIYLVLSKLLTSLSASKIYRRLVLGRSVTGGVYLAWSKADEKLYHRVKPAMSKCMRQGFLAHRSGRTFSRHGIVLDRMSSHRPTSSSGDLVIKRLKHSIFLLHYDAADFDAWHLKWHRRIFGNTTASAIHGKRHLQQEMFRQAVEEGGDAVRTIFNELFMFPPEVIGEFEKAGLVVKLDIPQLDQARHEAFEMRDDRQG